MYYYKTTIVLKVAVGESRTTLVEQNERLTQAFRILTESYQLALATLVTLHNKYLRSKEVKNIFNRYTLMREMIKVYLICPNIKQFCSKDINI